MTDETRPEQPGTEPPPSEEPTTALAEDAAEGEEKQPEKLSQTVEIQDVGPCKKHIMVSVDRAAIDQRLEEKFNEIMPEVAMRGFRPGKAPRKLITGAHRFQREIGDQVKAEVLLASLEQLAEDYDIAPLSRPDIDPFRIELPKEGPLVYEFEVEVRPQFDLPDYKGLKLKRPVHTFTDEELTREERRLLAPYGQVVPKPEGNAQLGDVLIADGTTRDGSRVLGTFTEWTIRVEERLAFKDGVAERFAEQAKGVSAGETRTVDVTLSSSVADESLRGRTVQMALQIKDVKTLRLPELGPEFLHNWGVRTPEQFHELVRVLVKRRLEYLQRQSARQQVMEHIAATSTWDLPPDLLQRQARRAVSRRIMEMRSEGIAEDEIRSRIRVMQQDILQSTALALKEHFVLQKIADVEKIEIDEPDIDEEIDRIAEQNNESPRRVRARLEKEDMMDALAAEIIERKALDLILESAEYEEVPLRPEEKRPVATMVEEQTVAGEMSDPLAPPPEPPAAAAPAEGQAPPSEQPKS